MRALAALAVSALIALCLVSTAAANRPVTHALIAKALSGKVIMIGKPPPVDMIPGDGGGGPVCQTVGNQRGYSYVVTAYFHYCYYLGQQWDTYGWADHGGGCCEPLVSWDGWDAAYSFGSGYTATGGWVTHAWLPWIGFMTIHRDTQSACIAADGWGNYWAC